MKTDLLKLTIYSFDDIFHLYNFIRFDEAISGKYPYLSKLLILIFQS